MSKQYSCIFCGEECLPHRRVCYECGEIAENAYASALNTIGHAKKMSEAINAGDFTNAESFAVLTAEAVGHARRWIAALYDRERHAEKEAAE